MLCSILRLLRCSRTDKTCRAGADEDCPGGWQWRKRLDSLDVVDPARMAREAFCWFIYLLDCGRLLLCQDKAVVSLIYCNELFCFTGARIRDKDMPQ